MDPEVVSDILVEQEEAIECIDASILALNECSENPYELSKWYDDTVEMFDANFASGATNYFETNSGFLFSYSMGGPRELYSHNVKRADGILKRMLGVLMKNAPLAASVPDETSKQVLEYETEVFVVHGHDEAVLTSVVRTIEKLGLNPVVLREQPNKGATIIEKFENNSNVGFAIVVMTGDDFGGKALGDISKTKFEKRARQNVVLEMGYFVGLLGRSRVCVLKSNEIEEPSDIFGVVYTLIDEAGAWKFELVRELKAAGYSVSADAII